MQVDDEGEATNTGSQEGDGSQEGIAFEDIFLYPPLTSIIQYVTRSARTKTYLFSYIDTSQHPSFPFSTMPDPSQMTDSQIEDANALLHDYHVAKENESEKEVVHGQDDGGLRTPRKNEDNTQP
jgi:hypothetical protein